MILGYDAESNECSRRNVGLSGQLEVLSKCTEAKAFPELMKNHP